MRSAGSDRLVDCRQCLLGTRPDGDVFGQIDPANSAAGIDVKFRRARDVITLRSGATMKNIVALNNRGIRVGQKRKCVSHLPGVSLRGLDRIDADGRNLHPARFEIPQPALKTPQLGVTEWSPIPTIKNQHRALRRKQIGKSDLFSILIG